MDSLPWLQLSGAIAGGLVGSFSGFISNSFHEQRVRLRIRRNIASALIGEIGALAQNIEDNYLVLLRTNILDRAERQESPFHHFRGDRDYMPIFRTIGSTIGHLPTPLPRELVTWYTSMATMLERAHALHDLAAIGTPESIAYAIELARDQERALMHLVSSSKLLLADLARL